MDNTEIKQKVQGAVDTNYHKELGLVRKMSTIIYNFYGRDHDAREIFPETADELATKLLKEVFNIEVVNPFRDDEYEAVTDETVEDILSKIKAKQSQPKSSLMANVQPPQQFSLPLLYLFLL